jgi:hypothetical protein
MGRLFIGGEGNPMRFRVWIWELEGLIGLAVKLSVFLQSSRQLWALQICGGACGAAGFHPPLRSAPHEVERCGGRGHS